jgi:nitroimidazol reductase NimA-like FMN-containing flavoprotein (pyridoxamine 5'-phosphate oxidase superfamily)
VAVVVDSGHDGAVDERKTADELRAIAASIVDENRFMTLATADADGRPWASPVWYAPSGYRRLLWVSSPDAQHSRNLVVRPELAIVIFDPHRPGGWTALYMAATAGEVEDVDEGIGIFSQRSVTQGLRAWRREDVLPPARHRLFRATVTDRFVLDPHDRRHPVSLE